MFRHLLGLLAGVAAAEGGPTAGDASGSDCIGVHSTEATLSPPGFETATAGIVLNMPESWPAAQQVRKLVETGLVGAGVLHVSAARVRVAAAALLLGGVAALSTGPKGGDPCLVDAGVRICHPSLIEEMQRATAAGAEADIPTGARKERRLADVWNQTLHTVLSHKADAGRLAILRWTKSGARAVEPKAVRIRPRCQRRPSHRHNPRRAPQNLVLHYELCPVRSDSAPPRLPAVLLRLRLVESLLSLLAAGHAGTPAVVDAFACFDASSKGPGSCQERERATEMTLEALVTDHLLRGSGWFNYSPFYVGPPVLRITGVHSLALTATQRVQLATVAHHLRSLQPEMQQYLPPCDICQNTTIMSAAEQRHATRRSATRAIVTFVSTPSYLVSARVLLHSLRSAGSRLPILVAVLEPSSPALKALYRSVRRMIDRDFGARPHQVSIVQWGVVAPPAHSREHPRWTRNYAKLHLFGMRQFDEILYVDSDAIALRNADDFFSNPIVRKSTARYLTVADWGAWARPPMDAKANGGVLFVRPSTSLLSCMLSTLRKAKATDFRSAEAEQGFLRFIFGDSAAVLPITFNMQKSNKKHNPSVFSLDRTTFLHFTGTKPHATWSRSAFLARFRPSNLRKRLAAVDQIDDEDPAYDELTAVWRRSYFRLAQLGRFLSLFVAYYNRASWARIWPDLGAWHPSDALVPLSLTPKPVDPNGLTIQNELPSLSDPAKQLQLGESAALLAIAKSKWYDKQWVGFATYNEQTKAVWQEGVSLDWVKVEEAILASREDGAPGAHRTVLFWYGIFAGDYWRLLDLHHAGMRRVLLQTLRDMNQQPSRRGLAPIDVTLIDRQMPPDRFWPFGNYVIMPAPLLREYAMFLEDFVEAFTAQYNGTCQFFSLQPDRCLSYVTERLIHVWAVTSGVELVYAVDDPQVRYLATCTQQKVSCTARDEVTYHPSFVQRLLRSRLAIFGAACVCVAAAAVVAMHAVRRLAARGAPDAALSREYLPLRPRAVSQH